MFNKWRMVMLGLVVFHGCSLLAMNKNELRNSGILQTTATKAILIQNQLSCSSEMRNKENLLDDEKNALKNMYFLHCGGGGSVTPPDFYGKMAIADRMKPVSWTEFPGR